MQDALTRKAYAAINDEIGDELAHVLERIKALFSEYTDLPFEMSEHFFANEGKLIRASLTFLLAKEMGGITNAHRSFACAIELMHAASLIHDDVIDREEVRRSQSALHKKWGNTKSILYGDLVITKAFFLFQSLGDEVMRRTLFTLEEMCMGQLLEAANRRNGALPLHEYERIIRGKTAALFSLATSGAALLHGQPHETFARAGEMFGMAFQIADDAEDVFTKDLNEGFITYPFIIAYERAKKDERTKAERALCESHARGETLALLYGMITHYDGVLHAKRAAEQYITQARTLFHDAGSTSNALMLLLDVLAKRAEMGDENNTVEASNA